MMKHLGLLLGMAVGLNWPATAWADQENPLAKDKTGLRWVLPFKQAQKKAADEERLLFIKPVAFGTSADGGW